MQWRFYLDSTEIDEPLGFDDLTLSVRRDPVWHGVFFEASNTTMGFYGDAYDIIKTAKETTGIDSTIIFTAQQRCEGETEYTTIVEGKLNFSSYSETCGNECIIRMNVEQENCAMLFKNRLDQKVNIESLAGFDGAALEPYAMLGVTMPLATQEIPISADAQVAGEGDGVEIESVNFSPIPPPLMIRPVYLDVKDNSILTGNLDQVTNFFQDPDQYFMLTPQVLLEEFDGCINDEFYYHIRLKGTVSFSSHLVTDATLSTVIDTWDADGPRNTLHTDPITSYVDDGMTATYSFDFTYSGTTPLPYGVGFYAYVNIVITTFLNVDVTYNFDRETSFLLSSVKTCPPTDASVFMINETLSRATEAITDGCLKVQSDYYGRVDSQPYQSEENGCGGYRVLTPGLKIRQANDKQFFASMKQLLDGLRPIDNIGMGMQSDRVRIEPAEWFYQDQELLVCDAAPDVNIQIEQQLIYSNIIGGYEKWEIKSVKGIDEFNSGKEYRTEIKAVNNTLQIRSSLIASGYIIENLRTTTLVNSGNTDNTYDNDIFIICVERTIYDASGFKVEQGNIENASNIFSPATAYNWRIRPLYNLMRWFKTIGQNIVRFTSGVGNYEASGNLPAGDPCRLENKTLSENSDVSIADFEDISDAQPIYRPEIITFDYPLSIADYNNIKTNAYGYISVSCGSGYLQGYIRSLAYKPAEGKAKFELIKR